MGRTVVTRSGDGVGEIESEKLNVTGSHLMCFTPSFFGTHSVPVRVTCCEFDVSGAVSSINIVLRLILCPELFTTENLALRQSQLAVVLNLDCSKEPLTY